MYDFQKDARNQNTHLFFSKDSLQGILKVNSEVLIMDCTYKTNRFKLPLMVITRQTALHTIFYIAFTFMAKETTPDYTWIVHQIKRLYSLLTRSDSVVILTDIKQRLMNAITLIFPHPSTAHLFCTWHINNNVTVNCKKIFNFKKV